MAPSRRVKVSAKAIKAFASRMASNTVKQVKRVITPEQKSILDEFAPPGESITTVQTAQLALPTTEPVIRSWVPRQVQSLYDELPSLRTFLPTGWNAPIDPLFIDTRVATTGYTPQVVEPTTSSNWPSEIATAAKLAVGLQVADGVYKNQEAIGTWAAEKVDAAYKGWWTFENDKWQESAEEGADVTIIAEDTGKRLPKSVQTLPRSTGGNVSSGYTGSGGGGGYTPGGGGYDSYESAPSIIPLMAIVGLFVLRSRR